MVICPQKIELGIKSLLQEAGLKLKRIDKCIIKGHRMNMELNLCWSKGIENIHSKPQGCGGRILLHGLQRSVTTEDALTRRTLQMCRFTYEREIICDKVRFTNSTLMWLNKPACLHSNSFKLQECMCGYPCRTLSGAVNKDQGKMAIGNLEVSYGHPNVTHLDGLPLIDLSSLDAN